MSDVQTEVDWSRVTTDDIEYKIAATRTEREEAFRLVYRAYFNAGLGEPNSYKMRVTPYHLLPTTEVFVARYQEHTICTITLVVDGELGLPMQGIYDAEVAERREHGFRLGEVSCLADRRSEHRRSFPVFLRLCRFTAQYAWRSGLHQLLVAVHPRHAKFYRRFMDFRTIGEERTYPSVRNHPAVALELDLVRLHRERSEAYHTLFAPVIPYYLLQPQPISPAQSDYFSAMVDPTFCLAPLGDAKGSERRDTAEVLLSVA